MASALAIDTSRARVGAPVAIDAAARATAGAANSMASRASARWCFTAWKLPIGHAELLALDHVGDGEVEHRPAEPDELGGGAERAPVEGERDGARGRR